MKIVYKIKAADMVKVTERIRGILRQALSPTFLIVLLGAAMLWYISKLGEEYTTEIEMGIRIDGQKYRLGVIVNGRGSAILAQQLSLKSRVDLTLDELSPRPSRETLGALTITPASLAKAINNKKISGLTVMEVTDAPEFTPPGADEAEKDKKDNDKETAREKRKRERLERRQAKEAEDAGEEAAREKASEKATKEKGNEK
jgi:hypothetical protein